MDHSIPIEIYILPSGKHTKTYGTSPFSICKSTMSMAIFHSKLFVYQRVMGSSAFFHHDLMEPYLLHVGTQIVDCTTQSG